MPERSSNIFTSEIVRPFVERIENFLDEQKSSLGSHRNRCGQIKKNIDGVYEEAKRKGLPIKTMKAYITGRQRLKSARLALADLQPDERETLQQLVDAMNDPSDLPLFKFAIDQAAAVPGDGLDALRTH